mmetsp:Transcript_27108/g.58089  ORF Transcript_27108/g.58089 Transcript_27108/m.58089 type:complete len:355 (+) Transcript_27108:91-1155(+)
MNSDSERKRRRDGKAAPTALPTQTNDEASRRSMMMEMKAMLEENNRSQMTLMQNELDNRLSRIDEVEAKCESMQNAMDDMERRLFLLHVDELEAKCHFLEAKCCSLERSLKSLTTKKKWEYSAPPIPSSHWTELGFDDEYIECMDLFLLNLKEQAIMLRSGEYCQDIELDGDEEGDPLIMLHNEMLLPHWQEFVDALQLYTHSEASNTFSISNVQLTPVIFNMLAPALKGKRFKLLSFSQNDFQDNCRDGINFVIEFTKNNPDLIDFSWNDNTILNMDDASHLIKAINNLPSLETINIIRNSFIGGDAYNLLCSLLEGSEHCERIYFKGNTMRPRVALAYQTSLRQIFRCFIWT